MTDPYAYPPPQGDPNAIPQPPPAAAYLPPGGLPVPMSGPQSAEAPLVTIGDITVTKNWVVVPQGRFPLRNTTWTVQDSSQVTEGIPTWAIVMTVVLFFCIFLFSLLFLLAKERKYIGFIAVSVAGEGFFHTVQLPPGPQSAAWATGQVNYARGLAAAAL